MTRTPWQCGVAMLGVLLFSHAAAAQGVGAIGGTVVDESGAVLPGVTMTLINPGTIGGNQTTVTDGRGAYQFTRLVPGRYSVRAELTGFNATQKYRHRRQRRRDGARRRRMTVGTISEQVLVTSDAPALDTTSALSQTVLSRETLDTLPNRSDVWAVARVIPSVVLSKVDVGGSESFLQSSPPSTAAPTKTHT